MIDSAMATLLADGTFANIEPGAISTRGHLAVARGDFALGIGHLSSIETARAPVVMRIAAARIAALGTWFGVVGTSEADSSLASARKNVPNATGESAAELQWLDGVIGIAAGDSARDRPRSHARR